jgi:type IV pilus assembly protein PilM
LSSKVAFRQGIYKSQMVRRMVQWLDAMPHPPVAIEIAPDRISAVRWSRKGSVDNFVIEPLPPGALVPSATETNIVNVHEVQTALEKACSRLQIQEADTTLLLPDPVVRVFVQHFENFPRSPQEALPLLRWKLKKSVPFDVDQMLISYVRQDSHDEGVNVVTALGRLSIVQEYEDLARDAHLRPGVVLSSSIAAVALLEEDRPTLMARISGRALTTTSLRAGALCGYRCTELPANSSELTPKGLLDEIFPVAAYYQDTWREGIQSVRVAGLGSRLSEFVPLFEKEFRCRVDSLLQPAVTSGRVPEDARPLADRELEGLIGVMLSRT